MKTIRNAVFVLGLLLTAMAPSRLTAAATVKLGPEYVCYYLGEYSESYEERWNIWICTTGDPKYDILFWVEV